MCVCGFLFLRSPYKHVIKCQNWAGFGPMLAASGRFWSCSGTLCQVYRELPVKLATVSFTQHALSTFDPGCSSLIQTQRAHSTKYFPRILTCVGVKEIGKIAECKTYEGEIPLEMCPYYGPSVRRMACARWRHDIEALAGHLLGQSTAWFPSRRANYVVFLVFSLLLAWTNSRFVGAVTHHDVHVRVMELRQGPMA